jgi:hypothetical protein
MSKTNEDKNGKPVNKSAAIRGMMARHPAAQSKEIVAYLAEEGVKVQPSLVYYIRSKQLNEKRRQKRQRVAETSVKTGNANPVELIVKVKGLARDAGGILNLKRLVDALAD